MLIKILQQRKTYNQGLPDIVHRLAFEGAELRGGSGFITLRANILQSAVVRYLVGVQHSRCAQRDCIVH